MTQDEDGRAILLHITEACPAVIRVNPEGADEEPIGEPSLDTRTEAKASPKMRTPRDGTKPAMLIATPGGPDGATIEETIAVTG